jgi:hypothetical protein
VLQWRRADEFRCFPGAEEEFKWVYRGCRRDREERALKFGCVWREGGGRVFRGERAVVGVNK